MSSMGFTEQSDLPHPLPHAGDLDQALTDPTGSSPCGCFRRFQCNLPSGLGCPKSPLCPNFLPSRRARFTLHSWNQFWKQTVFDHEGRHAISECRTQMLQDAQIAHPSYKLLCLVSERRAGWSPHRGYVCSWVWKRCLRASIRISWYQYFQVLLTACFSMFFQIRHPLTGREQWEKVLSGCCC